MNIHSVYGPILRYFRQRRVLRFYSVHAVTAETSVLDLGGSDFFWDLATSLGLPAPRVTVLNLSAPADVVADGRKLPFADQSFDLIFCNSVIEHVGEWPDQVATASEIRRVGRSWWVQTPDPRFPIEPHYLGIGVHWLPITWRRNYGRWFTLRGWINPAEVRRLPEEVRLLNAARMKELFPGTLLVERFIGCPKSLIASHSTRSC